MSKINFNRMNQVQDPF